jgi:signal transduction histidine kinase
MMVDMVLRLGSALVSTTAVGVVVLVAQRSHGAGVFAAAPWLWWTAYAVFVAVLLLDARVPGEWGGELWLAALCLSAVAVYLLAARSSVTAVCLVTSAASAAFVLGVYATVAVVAVQTAVIAAGQVAIGADATEVLATTAMFGGFQLFAVLMAVTALREAVTRARLAGVNDELRAAQALLRDSAQAGERLRISRELHDLVGHQLTALALELEVAAHHAGGDAARHVDRARGTAKDLLADLRRAVSHLRVTSREVPAVVSAMTSATRPRVHLDIDDDLDFADPDQAHTLVRCIQEIVTNTARHADADHLWITVRRTGTDVTISSRDDGRGAAEVRPGNGMTGMRERLEGAGGTLTYRTEPGRGFHLEARLPAAGPA